MYNVNLYNKNIEQQIVVWFKKYPDTHTCMGKEQSPCRVPGMGNHFNLKFIALLLLFPPHPTLPSRPHRSQHPISHTF